MRQSELFCKTKKEWPKDAEALSHKLLVRADFIEQSSAGVYRLLPLGYRVVRKIENIIDQEMRKIGGQRILLPALQNKNLWLETKRWETIDPPLFKLKDIHKRETALGPTHEEEITDLARKRVDSYQDLPFALFQIQNKFRNEIRPQGGLLRTREFIMKDLYSFHASEEDLFRFYQKVRKSYFRIFKRCGLKALCVQASSGSIGGELSEEFMIPAQAGEDRILICPKCFWSANIEKSGQIKKCPACQSKLEEKRAIELGHIFNLGTKYSRAMKAYFRDKDGKEKPIVMGCFGIGIQRLMATIVEISHDEKGIIWPKEVSPFDIHLIPIELSGTVEKESKKIYQMLKEKKIDVLYDDRKKKTAGEKLVECDLIGNYWRVVLSKKTLKKGMVEIKRRKEKNPKLVKLNKLSEFFKKEYAK